MKRAATAVLLTACIACLTGTAAAQCNSLFKNGKTAERGEASVRTTSLTRVTTNSDRDFKKHDLITIVVEEKTKSKTVADSETEKGTEVTATISHWPKLLKDLVVQDVPPAEPNVLKVGAERKFEGGGSKKRDDLFTERITGEIVDIKPNGTIVIEANKERRWMGETQILRITGIVRKEDISEDNTVNSQHIANLCLSYETKGQVSQSANRGLIDWILDLVNIF